MKNFLSCDAYLYVIYRIEGLTRIQNRDLPWLPTGR